MNKNKAMEALKLSQECLERYWQKDIEFTLCRCADDVSWIGAVQSQFMQGYDKVKEDFEKILPELQCCYLLNQEFIVAQNNGNVCTIMGRYLTTACEDSDICLQVQQRCTFVWELIDNELKIKHIHISNPLGELKIAENELFVNTLGKMAARYINKQIESHKNTRRISVMTEQNSLRFLFLDEIIYAEASRKNIIIHTVGDTVVAKMTLPELISRSHEKIISLHRSYAVNTDYITEIKRYHALLADDTEIPIPEKRYNEIRDKLYKYEK